MIVLKFGGTSLGDATRIRRVASIVSERRGESPVVVVSAIAGVTDALLALARHAVDQRVSVEELRKRHVALLGELDLPPDLVDEELEELSDLLRGIHLVGELTARCRDAVVSFGERMSSRILAARLSADGTPAVAVRADRAGLLTDERHGNAAVFEEAYELLRASLEPIEEIVVLTGFLGHDRAGRTTTLGRGGSDYSAAIVGRALGAREIQIWTDVDGVMTADPRLVPEARTIEVLSFAEASELAYYGAKVVHPSTMIPAVRANIPIRVLNTLRPESRGTLVLRDCGAAGGVVKSIASKSRIVLIHITSAKMLLHHGFLARIFEVFGRLEIVIDMIATSEISVSVTTDTEERVDEAVRELDRFAEVEVERPMGMICLVGEGLTHAVGTAGRVFGVLGDQGISARMISMGAGGTNISFLVREGEVAESVRALHRICLR